MTKYNVIDLFAGAGGLSEGFLEQGNFNFLAHIEWEKPMVDTLRNNLVKRRGYKKEDAEKSVILFDIQKTNELMHGEWKKDTVDKYGKYNDSNLPVFGLDGIVGTKKVDIIIGGPPCQAYSIAGRAQDPNSMKNDYRNYLFESFVKVVKHYKPIVFVFENVPGILSAKPGDRFIIDRIKESFDKIGYEIRDPKDMKKAIFSSANYGVPQDRRRVIIFGVQKSKKINVEDFYNCLSNLKTSSIKTVRDAIGDLPKFIPLKEPKKINGHNVSHQLIGNIEIPLHTPRYNNIRDIGAIKLWLENDMNHESNEKKIEFYKNITGKVTKHNKYRNLEWDKPSPTIVSHLSKDGFMFIHPDLDQLRTITIREAAILQSFPFNFEFLGSNQYCFKMIGNAVPVLFAKNIAQSIYNVLSGKLNEK